MRTLRIDEKTNDEGGTCAILGFERSAAATYQDCCRRRTTEDDRSTTLSGERLSRQRRATGAIEPRPHKHLRIKL